MADTLPQPGGRRPEAEDHPARAILATDGLSPAKHARRLLTHVGRRELNVTALCVAPNDAPPLADEATREQWAKGRRDQARAVAESTAGELTDEGFHATPVEVRQGDAALEILSALEDEHFDLVVCGAGNSSWLGNLLLGSVSTHLLHSRHCSMLIVHHCLPRKPRAEIVIGVDGSEGASIALEFFVSFADPDRSHVTAVSVVASSVVVAGPGYPMVYEFDQQGYEELIAHGRGLAEDAVRRLREAGFDAAPLVTTGHASTQLLTVAENVGAELVVVGSRGLGRVKRTILGSVSEQMARHAPAALIVFPSLHS